MMSNQKPQKVFHPLLNFWGSGLLIIFTPRQFFQSFKFIQGSWQQSLVYALCYKCLATLIYALSFQVLWASPLAQAVKDVLASSDPGFQQSMMRLLPVWLHVPTWVSVVLIPLSHIPNMIFWTFVIWAISQVSRCGFRFKETFNLLNSFAAYALLEALIFGSMVLFSNSAKLLLIVGSLGSLLIIVSLVLVVRTFHQGAQVVISDTLIQDPAALKRFYWVSSIILAIPAILVIIAAYVWTLSR